MLMQNLISVYFMLLKVFHVWFSHFQNFSSFLPFCPFRHNFSRTDMISQIVLAQGKKLPKFSDHFSLGAAENHILVFMCFLDTWKIQPKVWCRSVLQMQEITVKFLILVSRSLKLLMFHTFLDTMWPTIKLFCFFGFYDCLGRVQVIAVPNFRVQLFNSANTSSGF